MISPGFQLDNESRLLPREGGSLTNLLNVKPHPLLSKDTLCSKSPMPSLLHAKKGRKLYLSCKSELRSFFEPKIKRVNGRELPNMKHAFCNRHGMPRVSLAWLTPGLGGNTTFFFFFMSLSLSSWKKDQKLQGGKRVQNRFLMG